MTQFASSSQSHPIGISLLLPLALDLSDMGGGGAVATIFFCTEEDEAVDEASEVDGGEKAIEDSMAPPMKRTAVRAVRG